MKTIKENWYWVIVGAFLLCTALFYLVLGEDSYIAVHDNLDLFTAQYKMLKDADVFFAHCVNMPYLGGITRNDLPSEFALSSIPYMILPVFGAYVANYLLKIMIATVSFYLLAKELFGETVAFWKPLAVLCGFAYGLLNVFPAFGIPFASIPLLVYILLRVERAADLKKALPWYAALFAYPFVSYFSYFGLFICGYTAIAFVWVSIARKKADSRLLIAIPVQALGYVVFEYRLFAQMLLVHEQTIRSSMKGADLTIRQVFAETADVLVHSIFHAESLHCKWVMPLCLACFIAQGVWLACHGRIKEIFHNLLTLIFVLLLLNAFVYALYDFAPVRGLVERICPPLQGWQFNRTLYFNPFLWYAALFIVLVRIVEKWNNKAVRAVAVCAVGVAIFVIVCSDTKYNDLLHTGCNTAYKILKNKDSDCMNYREFYGEQLFEQAMEDLDYVGEWSAAYGFHPAVLEYNGISTLDGYLGFYPQSYKEAFRKIIAPALDRVEASRGNYDDWGARAYIYAGTDLTAVSEYKSFTLSDYDLYIDPDAFHELGGTYIFSRFRLTNADALGLEKAGEYENASIPYKLYVYK